jgi:hypothetical protein
VSQEISREPSQQQPVPASEIRPRSTVAGKRRLALLAIGLLIVLTLAVHPSFIKATWDGVTRILYAENTPPPPALLNNAKRAVQSPATPAMAPQSRSDPPTTDAQVQKLWTHFEKAAWGASLRDWSTLHLDTPCTPFRGNMWGRGADAQWAQQCSIRTERQAAAHWSFYIFSLEGPLVSRLEQFDETTIALPEDTLKQVQQSLQSRLAARYGPAEDRSPKIARSRAVQWPEYLRWQAADLEIQLNLSEFDPQRKEGRVRLQARHRALLDALNDDERLKQMSTSNFLYEVGSAIDAQLADDLRDDFPEAALMLMKQQPDPDPQKMREAFQQWQSQLRSAPPTGQTGVRAAVIALPQNSWKADEFHSALLRLLTATKTSPAARQPVLLLAADRLAWRLPWVLNKDKSKSTHWQEWRTQLAGLGVTYEQTFDSPDDSSWTYTGTLLRRVWSDYPETDWGERAFLMLLNHGWDTGVGCDEGSDLFRQVIQQGLPFLEKRPSSPYQLDVQLAVTQAYETWWSLSLPPVPTQGLPVAEDSDPIIYRQYQEGAEAARQQAIARYEQLLQSAPQSDQAAYGRRVLPRLKLGIDTGQRRFYCSDAD